MCTRGRLQRIAVLLSVAALTGSSWHQASADDLARQEFFESRIRPVLVDQCYACHNSTETAEGGLSVDHGDALRAGGDSGAAVVPGSPAKSLLLKAIRHEPDSPQMPQGAPRLSDRIIADFERWIAEGAFDPRDEPPQSDELSELTSWEAVRNRRSQWWSFQPIRDPEVPLVDDQKWSKSGIDRFLFARMNEVGLAPAPVADRRVLIRRLSFALTGLPPDPADIDSFLAGDSPEAYPRLVERLLRSNHFGERWARHWMDWMRYAETHGSEGDPAIPHAWRYRDYLIRALNADVSYDQLLREHIAGDLLPDPRINEELGINESMLGAAQYRFVQHGFAPTDALDELVRFTDNQIDVITKAFLGLTVSCARCHHHKFDPISQDDFYALYGVMISSRPATVTVDLDARQDLHRHRLSSLKDHIRLLLSEKWLMAAQSIGETLQSPTASWAQAVSQADEARHPISVWTELQNLAGEEFSVRWAELASEYEASHQRLISRNGHDLPWRSDLSQADQYETWFRHGSGMQKDGPSPAGEFAVPADGERIISGLYPAGAYSGLLSTKLSGVLSSPKIPLDAEHLYLRVRGEGEARARYVVQHYPRRGTVYPIETLAGDRERWVHWDMNYWKGDEVHIEISTAADQPVETKSDLVRSSFGVTAAMLLTQEQVEQGLAPQDEIAEFTAPLFAQAEKAKPSDSQSLAELYEQAVTHCVIAWRDGQLTDAQARFLNYFVVEGLLPNLRSDHPEAAALADQYRALEAEIPVPTRAPGVLEADVIDQPMFVRGNHKQPGETVPRRFLEVFDPQGYDHNDSGRVELAEDMLRPDNPLTARVIVNRVWHHLFGRGLVATPDNFGHLGAEPSHPELLDWLATRFVEEGWSIKKLIRRIVLSRAYQLNSTPTNVAAANDPVNQWLSHAPLRRLEAESIRDSLLVASGELNDALYGPPQDSGSNRRSIYLAVRRNDMTPLLAVFDQPTPFTTQGRRDVTNVPGQSLMLLNAPFINDLASRWGERLANDVANATNDDVERSTIDRMFRVALGRTPSPEETDAALRFMSGVAADYATAQEQLDRTVRQLEQLRASREEVLNPIRERLLESQEKNPATPTVSVSPIARWDFDEGFSDALGNLEGNVEGTARLEDGSLVLDGKSFVVTQPLDRDLGEKTLTARVQLDALDQRGGGVISVQSLDGSTFDAIVFGERQSGHWLAGSNNFRRTKDFRGPKEETAASEPVHVAIVYHSDGRITAYRNGQRYGEAYQSSGLQQFAAGKTVVTFGLRHLPPGGNRYLAGKILEARLYDRALCDEEILAIASDHHHFVPLRALIEEMTPEQREKYEQLCSEIKRAEAERQRLEAAAQHASPARRWQELAMTLFNLKEFIYVQ